MILVLTLRNIKWFVERDVAMGITTFGFHDTPNFVIVNNDGSNPEIIRGPQPFAAFRTMMGQKLGVS